MKDKLITAGVLFAGIAALAVATHYGAPAEILAMGGSALAILTAMLKSMLVTEPKP